MIAMMQNKLNELVGRSSGYIASLPPDVPPPHRRLKASRRSTASSRASPGGVLELEKKYSRSSRPLRAESRTSSTARRSRRTEVEAGQSALTDDAEPAEGEEKPAPAGPRQGHPRVLAVRR